jgi:preprotein translocase subunit SecD
VLTALIAVLYGTIGGGVLWGNAQWSPKFALDLEGGTEFVLNAVPQAGTTGQISQSTIDQAVKIIRQRVDGSGVAEAEVTTQGQNSIVVSLPGKNIDQATKDSIRKSAALEFRAVLAAAGPTTSQATPSGSATATPSGSAAASGAATGAATGSAAASAAASGSAAASAPAASAAASAPAASAAAGTPAPTSSANGMPLPKALLAATVTPSAAGGASPTAAAPTGAAAAPTGAPSAAASGAASGAAASGAGSPNASASPSPQPKPTDASDENWITADVVAQFEKVDCETPEGRLKSQSQPNDPKKPFIACENDGTKYVLGPAEVQGKDVSGASAGLETNSQGQATGQWQVNLTFDTTGADQFAKVTSRLVALTGARNQFAIVLDNLVISAPRTISAITGGQAQITGNFTQASSTALSNQLKFGALPISFQVSTESTISATLGDEQLRRGLLAGVIGLLLVVLYSLLQYRALGLVTVASLVIAGVVTYGFVVLLGWRQGLRLSLPSIAGLIVSIGITADSFIVYFERIRDEVRDGRGLLSAVELAWTRARRTILISDAVSFLAAVVLYVLAVGGVRGFAFTLGLTTVVDVAVVFLFTKPMVTLLARTRFFGSGHKLSGFDAAHLGRAVAYTGRGRTRTPGRVPDGAAAGDRSAVASGSKAGAGSAARAGGGTIAERRAARERAAQEASGGSGTVVVDERADAAGDLEHERGHHHDDGESGTTPANRTGEQSSTSGRDV